VLPKDYWSFRIVRERVNVEIAVTDATVEAIRSRLMANHSSHHAIDNDISMFQKFLKQTRKEILKIAEKRARKAEADAMERAPFVARIKKCDVRIKGAEKAIEVIRDKLRRAEVQVAAGNANGAAEIFIPPKDDASVSSKGGKKGANRKGSAKEPAAEQVYDFKTVYELMNAATEEITRLEGVIADQQALRKEGENQVRMCDWQCQRTSRMLRDLAENRFQTMVDVQLVAVREAKRLEGTEEVADVQSQRYKGMKKYLHTLTAFLEGPIAERGQQLAKESEQRRVSEILKGGSTSTSTRAEFSSPLAAQAAAQAAASKKRSLLAGVSGEDSSSRDNLSPLASFRSTMSRNGSEADFSLTGDRAIVLDTLGALSVEDDDRSVGDSVFSDGDTAFVMEERRRHQEALLAAESAAEQAAGAEDEQVAQDNRTSSQIAVDQEIELAHHNSLENRMKREAALKALAEEQAREMAAQDLRIRVFEEY
jgi:hypothetical protein